MEGKQLSGKRKRTSEILLHLAIMKDRPDVKSVVHCHPPHATAFAVAREPIPQCVLPEVEVFLGDVPITQVRNARRPGVRRHGPAVRARRANVIILANHGTVSFGETVEKAYWWTEILDAYCRILMLASDLGRVNYFTEDKDARAVGPEDEVGLQRRAARAGMENCDICANDVFRDSWKDSGRRAPRVRRAAGRCGQRSRGSRRRPAAPRRSGRRRSGSAGPSDHRPRDGGAGQQVTG